MEGSEWMKFLQFCHVVSPNSAPGRYLYVLVPGPAECLGPAYHAGHLNTKGFSKGLLQTCGWPIYAKERVV